ncbi:MAG: ATP-binding protein [Pyrinomonadaceae bacterium]|nr:ATP-binding protein [Pyrinomonadaceae bacterium]
MSQDKAKKQTLYAVPDPSQDSRDSTDGPEPPGEVCPSCYGTGMEFVEGKGVRRCQCRKQGSHTRLIETARIPRRYDNCHFHSYKPQNASQERAFRFSSRLTMDFPAVEKGLLLMGSVGVGKTHLAVSILKGLIERGFSCRFYEFGGLLKEIQNSYNPVSQTSEFKVLEPVFNSDILVLDEIGTSKPTDWVRDTMAHVINTRYNDKKLTIFTTNYLDKPKNSHEETLEERIGVRLRSRLYEMSKTLVLTGEDFRKSFDASS